MSRGALTPARRLGMLGVTLGFAIVAAARMLAPGAPPLYDGVVPLEPYLWVDPPPGLAGGPKGASADLPIEGGASLLVAVATTELQPQAQVFAQPGALVVAPGARTIHVTIEPMAPTVQPATGHISGNVYRILVVDDQNRPLTALESAAVSIVLRGGETNLGTASIGRLVNGAWQVMPAQAEGLGASFVAVVTDFGDFAVIAAGPDPYVTASVAPGSSPGASPTPEPSAAAPSQTGTGFFNSTIWPIVVVGIVVVAILARDLITAPRGRKPRNKGRDGWGR